MENNQKTIAVKSKTLKITAAVLGLVFLLLLVFSGGVAVGIRKARFSGRFIQNYERNFVGGPDRGPAGMMHDFPGRDFRNPHGLAGNIISVSDNTLTVRDRDGMEISVNVTDKTVIKKGGSDLKITDLKPDEKVTVLGKPGEDGKVNADFIRVFASNDNDSSNQAPAQENEQNSANTLDESGTNQTNIQ